MALNPERIQKWLHRIEQSDIVTFQSEVGQLFQYLAVEGKDNLLWQKYEAQTKDWENWLEGTGSHYPYEREGLPTDKAQAQSLAYSLYKTVVECQRESSPMALGLYDQQDFQAFIDKFNATFLVYFRQAVEDIGRAHSN